MSAPAGGAPHPGDATAAPWPPLKWDALQVALAVLLFLQIWRVQELFPSLALYGLPSLATLVAVVLFFLDRDPRRRCSRGHEPVVRAALGMLVLAALSVPGSLYPSYSLGFIVKDYLRSVVLMLLVAGSVRGMADLRRLGWVQLAGVTLYSAVTVARSRIGAEGRLIATAYYDENDLAMLIVCTLPLILYLWRRPARLFGRLVIAAATVFLMMTLGKTGSRGAFLGFLAVAAYLRLRGVSWARRVVTVAVLAVLLVALASDRYFTRIETILHPSADYNWSGKSETGRMEVWRRGLGYMLDHPVLGVGVAAFGMAEGTLSPEAREQRQYGRSFKWSAPHNSFIEVGAELGVLGLILFVALVVGAFGALARVRRGASGEAVVLAQILTAALIAFVVTCSFLSQAYAAYLYALLGMILGLARVAAPVRARLVHTRRVPGYPVAPPIGVGGVFPRWDGPISSGP
jgi:O-antigen ligase